MNLTRNFNNGILKMIEQFSDTFYFIKRDETKKCTCVKHETSQANPACEKCLGTGYRITIQAIRGAAQDTKLPPTFRSDNFIVARNFYVRSEHYLDEDDIIVDNNIPYMVMEQQDLNSLEGTMPYRKICGVKKKFDSEIFIKNFNKIINKRSR